jgi:hypothetical protein
MTSDIRREAVTLLAEVWGLSPDVRLGQLLAHLGFLGEQHLGRGLGDIDDDEFMAILQRHRAELEARLLGTPTQSLQQGSPSMSVSGSPILADPALELGR